MGIQGVDGVVFNAFDGRRCIMLGGCGTWRGDEEVETEPEEGRSEGPGLFTGKEGGIIIFER